MSDSTKPCRFCGKRINAKSIYCKNCQNFQNWRGTLAAGAAMLAVLASLVAVLGPMLPAVKSVLAPGNSDLRFSIQTVSQDGFSAMVSNAGDRPGTIQPGAHVRVTERDGKTRNAMLSGVIPDQEAVKPGSSLLRKYKLLPIHLRTVDRDGELITEVDDTLIKSGKEQSCAVQFAATDFLGNSTMSLVPFDCQKLPSFKLPISAPSQE